MSLLTKNDEDGDGSDAVLLSSAAVHALVPEVRFVIATIVIRIMVVMVCRGDAIYYYCWLDDRVRKSLRVAGLYVMHPCVGNDNDMVSRSTSSPFALTYEVTLKRMVWQYLGAPVLNVAHAA